MKGRAAAIAVTVALNLAAGVVRAEPPDGSVAVRAEAGERFDRGLRLFNGGDTAGALAEFKRAYDLVPNVLVLYNIGLVYAQMGRPVEASDALEKVLTLPGSLSAERRAIAERTRNDEVARVATVEVASSVDAAMVEVDGVEAGKTPLSAPLRVASGTHVIGVVAAGFLPQRKEVTIAGGQKQALEFDLVAMQGRAAHLAIKTHLPGADLFVDDARLGVTPFATSVSIAPGAHRVELRRPGYATARTDITLGDGATGEIALEPEEDSTVPPSDKSVLALDIRQTEAVVTVDGRTRGVYSAPLRLAPGLHTVRVDRGDFDPFERDVRLEPGRSLTLPVALEPTPDYRARYVSHAQAQRTWGWVSVIAGAAVAAGGAGLLIYDAKQRSDGNAALDALESHSERGTGQVCDPGQEAMTYQTNCLTPASAASSKVSGANTRDYGAWAAVGIGAASVGLGVMLLVLCDDPHRYDDARDTSRWPRDVDRVRVGVSPVFGAGGGGASIVGAF